MKKMSPFTVKLSPIVDVRFGISSMDLSLGSIVSSYAPSRPIPLEGPSDVEISANGELSVSVVSGGVMGDLPLEHPIIRMKPIQMYGNIILNEFIFFSSLCSYCALSIKRNEYR